MVTNQDVLLMNPPDIIYPSLGYYGGPYGDQPRCPTNEPTWCICKWATARWIKGEGCKV